MSAVVEMHRTWKGCWAGLPNNGRPGGSGSNASRAPGKTKHRTVASATQQVHHVTKGSAQHRLRNDKGGGFKGMAHRQVIEGTLMG